MATDPIDPAFNGLPGSGSPGLTKREYFAALAMQGYLAWSPDSGALSPSFAAKVGVECADALIAELNREVKP